MTQPVYPRIGLFIDGKWEYDHPTGPQVRNPSNEAVLACVPLAEILFRYEAPALADAANGALRRDAEH